MIIIAAIAIRTYSLETRAKPAVLCTYVENQAILELILLAKTSYSHGHRVRNIRAVQR